MGRKKKFAFFHQFFEEGETARFQVIAMIITAIIVSLFFVVRLEEDAVISDPIPEINFYLPAASGALRMRVARVDTGIAIKNFAVFDTRNNIFVCDATIWFEYNPIMTTLDTISKFSFQKGKFLKKSPPDIKIIGDEILARFEITVEFTTSLDQRFFPFDDHRIDLMLTNEFVTYDELIYVAKDADFTVAKSIYAAGYQYLDKQVEAGYIKPQSEDSNRELINPVVLFSMEFGKAGARKPILIILPLLLMFFIALFGLTRNPLEEKTLMLRLVISALPAILAYRFVIENMSPKVGYSTLTDHIFSFILAVAFGSFLIVSFYASKGSTRIDERIIRRVYIIVSYLALIGIMYYLFFYWGR